MLLVLLLPTVTSTIRDCAVDPVDQLPGATLLGGWVPMGISMALEVYWRDLRIKPLLAVIG